MAKASEVFKENIGLVQKWMNENVNGDPGFSAKKIYAAMAGTPLAEMKEQDFQVQLSVAIGNNSITGFVGKKGRVGGYFPVGNVPVNAKKVNTVGLSNLSVNLGGGFHLINSENNWTLKRPTGSNLHFGNKMGHALKRVSEVLIQENIVEVAGEVKDLLAALNASEARVLERLNAGIVALEPVDVSDETDTDDETV